jgi:hypothetical protein
MQAIVTKYSGPTNHSRRSHQSHRAHRQGGSVIVAWDYALDTSANHRAAAVALADKFKWLRSPLTYQKVEASPPAMVSASS